MATQPPISEDEVVTQIKPIDLTGVRDPGMRALVLLAAALGWNVIQKINNPIALVARDGTQRRLPTNTSIRMSVFQSALSQIMVHTVDREASPLLIDAIVKETKIDRDHERRLRLAIGETAEEHKARLANDKVAEQKREPDEHLTQPLIITADPEREKIIVEIDETGRLSWTEPPHDGNDHGALVSREPFVAHHQSSGGRTHTYRSDSSFERKWADGYKDYECMNCGQAFKSPRSVGAHSQVHTKSGEKDNTLPAWQRAKNTRGIDTKWAGERRRQVKPPVADDLVFGELPKRGKKPDEVTEAAMAEVAQVEPLDTDDMSAETIVDLIAELVAPAWRQRALEAEAQVTELTTDLAKVTEQLNQLQADWEALRGLIGGR